jgi:hypothetical protein
MLKDFGNIGVMKLNPPANIKELAMLGKYLQTFSLTEITGTGTFLYIE